MNKELQDKVWVILPKEFKEEVKHEYRNTVINGVKSILVNLFGNHNLTSDAEGEELLTCEKYKVEEALNYCDELDSISGSHNMLNWGKQMIVYLFGSKCLLDEPSPAPNNKAEEIADKAVEPVKEFFDKAEPIKPKSDNMEDKELNLCEILQGHEGEEFYSPLFGKCTLIRIKEHTIILEDCIDGQARELYQEGYAVFGGEIMLFPSRNLYLKYPLDAKKAWNEWQEELKPKTPKTWSELSIMSPIDECEVSITHIIGGNIHSYTKSNSLIEKSALALLKIHQLIELGYGGNVTNEEWKDFIYEYRN